MRNVFLLCFTILLIIGCQTVDPQNYVTIPAIQKRPVRDIDKLFASIDKETYIVSLNTRSLVFNYNGEYYVKSGNGSSPDQRGKIILAKFNNATALEEIGDLLFRQTSSSGAPVYGTAGTAGFGSIVQGFREMTHPEHYDELVDWISSKLAEEASARMMKRTNSSNKYNETVEGIA